MRSSSRTGRTRRPRLSRVRNGVQLALVFASFLGIWLGSPDLLQAEGEAGAKVDAEVDSPGARALRAVAEPFQALETFRAEFVQSQEWIGSDEPTFYRGNLYIQRPGQFRIEYSEPKGHLQVSDGTHVWTYVPENEQVLVAQLPPGLENNDLLGRILEESRAEQEIESVSLDGEEVEVITLHPPIDLELRTVRLWTGAASSEILQYELTESSGNRTTYRLKRTWENPELEEDLFRFEAPKGVPVVEVGTQ